MEKIIVFMFFFASLLFSADIRIPVQGYLTDNEGNTLNGEQDIKFSLYNSDENGDLLWENQDTVKINLQNGEFSHMLGTSDYINGGILENASPLYLEVEVNGETLKPRIEIGVEAKSVYSYNSEKLNGKSEEVLKNEIKNEINNESLNAILSRLSVLEEKVNNLENENINLKNKVSALEIQNQDLSDTVTNLKNKLDKITVTSFVNLDDLKTNLADNQIQINNNKNNIAANTHDLNDSDGRLQYFIDMLSDRITSLEEKTADMSIVYLNYEGINYKTIRFSHVNVQIVNGSGKTQDRYSAESPFLDGQGLGNLIIGYNESSSGALQDTRTGYHNLIVGSQNQYTSYGTVVFGRGNKTKGMYSGVTGGYDNEAVTPYSSISGGTGKTTPSGTSNWFYWIGDQYHSE